MAGLSESIWAHAPSTPSISAGQNATKTSREPRNTASPSPRSATRRRGRGGNGTKHLPKTTGSDNAPATQPTPVTNPVEQPSTPIAPQKDTPPSAPSTRPRAPPRRNTKSDSPTIITSGSTNASSGTNTASPVAKDENTASESGSPSARKNSRRRAPKPAARRKQSSAMSVASTADGAKSVVVEPATPITPSTETTKSSSPVDTVPEVPNSPKDSSSGPEMMSHSAPVLSEPAPKSLHVNPGLALHMSGMRPATPASASHIDWADDDDADDLPDLDDWGVTPAKHDDDDDDEPKALPQRRRSSAAKSNAQEAVLKVDNDATDSASSDVKDAASPISPTTSVGSETVTSSADSASPAAAAARPFKRERPPLTDEQAAEKKRIKNRETRERRKLKKTMTEGAKAGQDSGDLASRIGGLVIDESKAPVSSTPKDTHTPSGEQSSLPAKPVLTTTTNGPTSAPNRSPPIGPGSSLPARPSNPSTPSPTNSNFPPRRKPFGGEPSFLSGQRRQSRAGGSSDFGGNGNGSPGPGPRSGGAAGRRERPVSHHTTRPVLSQGALSQLTKSLSGGARTHRPEVTAE